MFIRSENGDPISTRKTSIDESLRRLIQRSEMDLPVQSGADAETRKAPRRSRHTIAGEKGVRGLHKAA